LISSQAIDEATLPRDSLMLIDVATISNKTKQITRKFFIEISINRQQQAMKVN